MAKEGVAARVVIVAREERNLFSRISQHSEMEANRQPDVGQGQDEEGDDGVAGQELQRSQVRLRSGQRDG